MLRIPEDILEAAGVTEGVSHRASGSSLRGAPSSVCARPPARGARSTRVREGVQLKSIGNDAEARGGTFDLASWRVPGRHNPRQLMNLGELPTIIRLLELDLVLTGQRERGPESNGGFLWKPETRWSVGGFFRPRVCLHHPIAIWWRCGSARGSIPIIAFAASRIAIRFARRFFVAAMTSCTSPSDSASLSRPFSSTSASTFPSRSTRSLFRRSSAFRKRVVNAVLVSISR